MIIAIFGVLLLLNRQTGGMFEGFFIFVFPIPMVAYSAKHGLKSSLPVFFCTILISFLCGTPTSIFYAISESLIGMVFGARIYGKKDMRHTLFIVVVMSAALELVSTLALASLFGIDLNADIAEMQKMLNTVAAQAGVTGLEDIFSADYLRRIYVISIGFVGALEGVAVYYLSLAILRKLRYPIPKAEPLFDYYPHKAVGIVCLLLTFLYQYTFAKPLSNEVLQNIVQSVGICATLFLSFFGYYALVLALRIYLRLSAILGAIISVVLFMLFSAFLPYLGFFYLSMGLHEHMAETLAERQKQGG